MISRMRIPVCSLLLTLTAAGLLGACTDTGREWQHTGKTMGTTYTVTVANCPDFSCTDELTAEISAELLKINQQMSHFDSDSELSRFNASESTDWQPVSPELAAVVELALSISELSDGAFDITVASAVNAWGFGPQENAFRVPSDETVSASVRHSGWQKLLVRTSPPELQKIDPLMKLDLSAIAKGFAVDQLAYLLEFNGVQNYLVEIGGEIRTAGVRSNGKSWRIGIEQPGVELEINFVVAPGENAIATSGDYRNFWLLNGEHISHAIDPQSGRPAETEIASVTVVDASASVADALATALMVMGAKKAVEFAGRNDIPALFIVRDGDNDNGSQIVSVAFEAYLTTD